jgi:hypothetical protein
LEGERCGYCACPCSLCSSSRARERRPFGPAPEVIASPPSPSFPPPEAPANAAPSRVPAASNQSAPASPGALSAAALKAAGSPGPAATRTPPTATGKTYYVAPNGGGSACSQAFPCREISAPLEHTQPGDVVLVADGTYASFSVAGISGTAAAPIVIYAQGSAANVSPGGDRDSILVENSFYVTLDGLNAGGAERAGLAVICSNHVAIRNGRYLANHKWGIFSGFADDLVLEHNEAGGSKVEHGIYVSNSADRPIIRANLSHDNAGCGIQINADVSTTPEATCAWKRAGGVVDGICTGAVVEDNVLYGNGSRGGAGINLDGVQDSIVRNNLLFENHASGIANFDERGAAGPKGMEIVGNTVVQAAGARNGLLFLATTGPSRVRDNILYHPDPNKAGFELGGAADIANVDSDDNVVDRFNMGERIVSLKEFQATYKKEAHSIAGATPAQLFSDAAARIYTLAPGSPAIGHGTFEPRAPVDLVGKARPSRRGEAPDIGALQH